MVQSLKFYTSDIYLNLQMYDGSVLAIGTEFIDASFNPWSLVVDRRSNNAEHGVVDFVLERRKQIRKFANVQKFALFHVQFEHGRARIGLEEVTDQSVHEQQHHFRLRAQHGSERHDAISRTD